MSTKIATVTPPMPTALTGLPEDTTDVVVSVGPADGSVLTLDNGAPAWLPSDSLAFLDTLYPGWQPYDPTATYADGDLVFNDGLMWQAHGDITPGDSEPPTAANGGDWFYGPYHVMDTVEFADSLATRITDASNLANAANTLAYRAIPMDPENVINSWSADTAYKAGNLCRVYSGERTLYFSSDIDQIGGTAPSLTNVATWTLVDGVGMLTNPYLFWHPLDDLKDVTAPADTPAGKVLGTTAVGTWGPIDPPAAGGDFLPLTGGFVSTADGYFLDIDGGAASFGAPAEAADESEMAGIAITEAQPGGPYALKLLSAVPAKLVSPAPVAPDDLVTKGYVDGRIWKGTQAAYDALPTKDPNVLFVVTG
jgi:hypothetical protein